MTTPSGAYEDQHLRDHDPEVYAMAVIVELFDQMMEDDMPTMEEVEDARQRIMRWMVERWGVADEDFSTSQALADGG